MVNRAISDPFVQQLQLESQKSGWWADVLNDPKLVVGLRGDSLNVYWRGQSLFNVRHDQQGVKATTHGKYLLDPALTDQVPLVGGAFDVEGLLRRAFIKNYGPDTIGKMKRAAGLFAGREKIGCHEIAVRNPTIIDVEIAFPGKAVLDDGTEKTAPRVDFASVEPSGDQEARLVFWEAKDYINPELRSRGEVVPVCSQIKLYKDCLSASRAAIESSYTLMAANLVAIKKMGWKRELSPLFDDIAKGKRRLTLGQEPDVRLVIFGFDARQRDEPRYKEHLARLAKKFPVRAAGDAKVIRL